MKITTFCQHKTCLDNNLGQNRENESKMNELVFKFLKARIKLTSSAYIVSFLPHLSNIGCTFKRQTEERQLYIPTVVTTKGLSLSLYVCLCTCVCDHMLTCVCNNLCTCVCDHVCNMSVYMCLWSCVCVHVFVTMYMWSSVCDHVCTCVCNHMSGYMCLWSCICVYVFMIMCLCTCVS